MYDPRKKLTKLTTQYWELFEMEREPCQETFQTREMPSSLMRQNSNCMAQTAYIVIRMIYGPSKKSSQNDFW